MSKIEINKAILYVRISSEKQKNESDSINSQIRSNEIFANSRGFDVVEVFTDVQSGRYKNRPGMDALIAFLKTQNEPHAVIIDSISRLSRSIINHIGLREEIREAGGVLMSPSMEFKDDPLQQLSEKIQMVIAEQESLNIAHHSKSRMKARMQNGFWVFKTKPGFKYEQTRDRGAVLVRDEPSATIIAGVLTDFANGQLQTQAEVMRALNANPRFPKGKTGGIRKQAIKPMLTYPLYAGYIDHEPYAISMLKGQHEPIISLATYQKIQERLAGKPKFPLRLDVNPAFPLRGFVKCAGCDVPLKAAHSKGRTKTYAYYVCQTNGKTYDKPKCEFYGKSIRGEKLEGEFEDILKRLTPSNDLKDMAMHMFKVLWERNAAVLKSRQKAAQAALTAVENKIANLIERVVETTQATLVTAYENQIAKLETDRLVKQEQLQQFSAQNVIRLPDYKTSSRTALGILLNPHVYWASGNINARRIVAKQAFAENLYYHRENGFSNPKMTLPFQLIQSLNSNRKEETMQIEKMVPRRGLEPPRPYGHFQKGQAVKASTVLRPRLIMERRPLPDINSDPVFSDG